MSKKKKYTLTCRQCAGKFESVDAQVRMCPACVKKEQGQQVPKGPKPIDEMIR